MTDYKKKYEEEKAKRLESEELFNSLEKYALLQKKTDEFIEKIEDQDEILTRAIPIKGLSKEEVDILCELLVEAKYLDNNHYFNEMFEPYFGMFANGHKGSDWFEQLESRPTNWNGKQTELLNLLKSLEASSNISSKRHFFTVSLFLTIDGKKTDSEKLAAHSRQAPMGSVKMDALIKEYKKLIRVI